MAIRLTEAAARRVAQILRVQQPPRLRLHAEFAQPGTHAYVVEPAAQINDDDVQFDDQGVRLVVSRDSLPILDGMELDYRKEGLNEAFKFNNPNVKESCGCGESFSVSA
jgi:iron-sulfur cluster assembly protein